jgi:hypothetical protein
VGIVGAAWLLMGQRTVSEARIFADRTSAGAGAGAAGAMPPAVSIVELRRRVRQQRERTAGGSGRTYHYRWTWPRSGVNGPAARSGLSESRCLSRDLNGRPCRTMQRWMP